MSAYVMNAEDIGQLADYVAHLHRADFGGQLATSHEEAADLLAVANCESVGFRYSFDCDEAAGMAGCANLADFRADCRRWASFFREVRTDGGDPAVEFDRAKLGELVKSFRYQACEVPDWENSTNAENRVAAWITKTVNHLFDPGNR